MSDSVTRVLLIEDDEDDYLLTQDTLSDIGEDKFDLCWVQSYEAGLTALANEHYDVCLVDYFVGGETGLDIVREAKARGVLVPSILLTGQGDREVDIAAMEAGASDYLEKAQLTASRLDRSIRYAVNEGRTRRALSDWSTLLKAALDHTGAGIATFDTQMRLLTCNDRLLDMLGLQGDSEELNQADPTQPMEHSALAQPVVACMDPARLASEEQFELKGPGGRVFEVRGNRMPGGGIATICIDVTAQKAVEEQLRRAKENAEIASRSKSEFIANMSHELRTPLNAIIGFTELLANDTQGQIPRSHATAYLTDILASGHHLLSVINDILDVSKIEAGKFDLQEDSFDLFDVVQASTRLVKERALNAKLELGIDVVADQIILRADERVIKQVLLNLLSNAIKFTPAGGSVSVGASWNEQGGIDISIADTGIGMSQEDIPRVLQPFEQVESALDRNQEGTGLGLPLVKSLVELHDGGISIQSEKDSGTTVIVSLPPHRTSSPEAVRTLRSSDASAVTR